MDIKILISGHTNIEQYVIAVEQAGGIATAGYLPEADLNYDGLVLCGGVDVHPSYYNEEINGAVNMDEARDTAEFALAKAFVEEGKPVLGICRGCQLLNVFFGGSLYQHMTNTVLHNSNTPLTREHEVEAVQGSMAEALYGKRFIVNSLHHQAIKKLGNGLSITMLSDDGIVEGLAHETLPVFAVQWHPERLISSETRRHAVDGGKIFSCFIDMCKQYQLR